MLETNRYIPESEIRSSKEVVKEQNPNLSDIKVGETLTDQHGDRYFVEKQLGEGGVGAVYKVILERTGVSRALKIILPSMYNAESEKGRQDALKRFQSEILTLSHLQNPFILTAIDVIEIVVGGQKTLGFVTEIVEGSDLFSAIELTGIGLPCDKAVEYAGEIAIALGSLEHAHLVHRDLKPENIFLQKTADGQTFVRVGDFGYAISENEMKKAKSSGESVVENGKMSKSDSPMDAFQNIPIRNDRLTEVGMIGGTPRYMSPEQMSDNPMTHKSDLHALGTILYEMISGKVPFEGENISELYYKKLHVPPQSFSDRGMKNVPAWLEEIVMKLLRPDPDERFDSAKEVFVALKEGVKKDYPKLLRELPFSMNFGSDIDASRFIPAP